MKSASKAISTALQNVPVPTNVLSFDKIFCVVHVSKIKCLYLNVFTTFYIFQLSLLIQQFDARIDNRLSNRCSVVEKIPASNKKKKKFFGR